MSGERRHPTGLRLASDAPALDPRLHPAAALDEAHDIAVDPAHATRDEHALAAELFVHGLMSHLVRDMAAERERRVQAVMAALPSRAIAAGDRVLLPLGEGLRAAQIAAAAMLLAAVGALSVFAASGEQQAAAIVQRSIAASGGAGDRTYRVTPVFDDGDGMELPPARLDLRDGGQHRFAATLPGGHGLVAGRDVDGSWIVDHEGRVQRFVEGRGGPRPPRWIDLGESLFLAQSIDELLAVLPQDFSLRSISSEALPDDGGATMQRITARKMGGFGPDPRRIELWIAPDSGVVHRMELHWDRESPGAGRGARREPWQGPPGCGPRGAKPMADDGALEFGVGCGPDEPGLDGPRDRFGAPPPAGHGRPLGISDGDAAPPRGPPPPDGARGGPHGGGPPPPPDGAGHPRTPHMGDGALLRPDGGRAPRHGPDGRRGEARRRGDAPPLLAAPVPQGEREPRPPRFVERPTQFGRGDRPPPPRSMIFDLVSTEPLPADWFVPQRAATDSAPQ